MMLLKFLIAPLGPVVRFGLVTVFAQSTLAAILMFAAVGFTVGPSQAQAAELEPNAAAASLDRSRNRSLDQERIYYSQQGLMDHVTSGLASERPGITDLYFVGFGGFANQDVFMKEVMSVRALFDHRFDTQSRSIALINNRRTLDFLPLANQHNLATALGTVAERMNVEEDVLFLFLTSHGSEDHRLSTDFWPLGLNSLSAERLDAILDASGIKWRIVVVSACYSGGFIAPLQDEHSLILTASRADRNSFGCDHLNDFTYFGEAYFDHELRRQTDFVTAFHDAVAAITLREESEGLTPSEPQIFIGEAMADKLPELEARLGRLAEVQTNSVLDRVLEQVGDGGSMMGLDGKVAIVTGAGSGFGAAIARRFAEAGAAVVLADINGEGGRAVADQIGEAGGRAHFIATDVSQRADVEAMVVSARAQFGGLHILVNNAGVSHRNQPLTDVTEAEFDRVYAINVKAIYLSALVVVPVFRAQGGGCIINTSSTAAERPRPGLTWYNGSKGAVNTLTKSMAVELAPDKIRVNAISPVIGETALLETFMGQPDTPETRAKFVATIPWGRMSRPEDIAEAALFLASDQAEMVTGHCLPVDGGRTI